MRSCPDTDIDPTLLAIITSLTILTLPTKTTLLVIMKELIRP